MTPDHQPIMPRSDPALVRYIQGRIVANGTEPEPFAVLSDEEIIAMDGHIDSHFSLLPWATKQTSLSAEQFATVGTRSMIARGVLTRETGSHHTHQPEELVMAMAARRSGIARFRFARKDGQYYDKGLVVSLQRDQVSVVEEIARGGIHTFTALDHAAAIDKMAKWTIEDSVWGERPRALNIPLQEWHKFIEGEIGLPPELGTRIDLHLPTPGGESMYTEHWAVCANGSTAWLGTSEVEGHITARPTSVPQFSEALGSRIADAVAALTP